MNKIVKSKVPLFFILIFDTLKIVARFFFIRRKTTTNHDFKEPFFIIGCGRSGNTLLRSILVAGGEVSIPPESYVWPRIIRRFSVYSFLPWDMLSSMIVSEFESYKEFYTWESNLYQAHLNSRKLDGKKRTLSYILNEIYTTYNKEKGVISKRWGDKTPINTIYINKILKVFPKAQYIHIKRNPKDVVCSYVKAGLYEKYEDAAQFWHAAVTKANWLKNKLPPQQFYEIEYEALVSDPENEIENICQFLNISYTNEMLDFWKNKDSLGDVKYGSHHKNVGSPISTTSIGKWKDVLSKEDILKIEAIVLK